VSGTTVDDDDDYNVFAFVINDCSGVV